MLISFKTNGEFAYVNPDRVFLVRKWDDENTIILSDDEANVIVNEPLDRVAMVLNNAMRR